MVSGGMTGRAYAFESRTVKRLLQVYLSTPAPQPMLKIYGRPEENTTIGKLVGNPGICNHDILFHMQGILMYPYQEDELFDDFPYFGDRIRLLTIRLREQKPRTLKQIWRDSRDTTQWWAFWLILIIGVPSLLLAFGSFAASVAQTWAAFRTLQMSQKLGT
jgi:hypothetical protein